MERKYYLILGLIILSLLITGFFILNNKEDLNIKDSNFKIGNFLLESSWAVTNSSGYIFTNKSSYNSGVMVNKSLFLNMYEGGGGAGFITSFIVNHETLVITNKSTLKFDTNVGTWNDIVKINDSDYLGVYSGTENDGFALIFHVNASMNIINNTPLEFDMFNSSYNEIIKVNDSVYLVAYRSGVASNGTAVVLVVNNSLGIRNTSSIIFNVNFATSYHSLAQINETHFLLTYKGVSGKGYNTFLRVNQSLDVFEEGVENVFSLSTDYNALVKINETYFFNVYSDDDGDGSIVKFIINKSFDSVNDSVIDFSPTSNAYNSIVLIINNTWLVSYFGNNRGFVDVLYFNVTSNLLSNVSRMAFTGLSDGFHNSLVKINNSRYINFYSNGTLAFGRSILLDVSLRNLTPPNLILNTPSDVSSNQPNNMSFTANITSIEDSLENFSLYTNISGVWVLNQTKIPTLPINNASYDFFNEINMTGCIVYLPFLNDTNYGENATQFHDYCGQYPNINITSTNFDLNETTKGKLGYGLDTDPDDFISILDGGISLIDSATGAGQPRSWGYWITMGSVNSKLITDKSNFNGVHFYSEQLTAGGLHITGGVAITGAVSTGTLNTLDWYHIVFTYNGTHTRLYQNGNLIVTPTAQTAGADDLDQVVRIGGFATLGAGFAGKIDEVFIFNRSLSDSEVARIYNLTRVYKVNFTGVDNIPNGTYSWNVLSYNNESQTAWAISNYTFTIGIGGESPADSCSPTSPLSANYQYECSDSCIITSNIDANKFNITFNGTGNIRLEANITNYTKITIRGTDTSNICRVTTTLKGSFKA